jgi:hypothetical protein
MVVGGAQQGALGTVSGAPAQERACLSPHATCLLKPSCTSLRPHALVAQGLIQLGAQERGCLSPHATFEACIQGKKKGGAMEATAAAAVAASSLRPHTLVA